MKFHGRFGLLTIAAISTAAMPVAAQTSSDPPQGSSDALETVMVSARKRDETLISAPVVIAAVSEATLQKYAVNDLDDVARRVPQLLIGPQGGSVQGGNVSIRGIAGPDSNPFGDQAVSFNLDGVAVSMSTVRRMASTDLSGVEVLKGPQALFYGKNSPAGVVSVHTADPTNQFEAGAKLGYEAYGREYRDDVYVSGPLNDAFSDRFAQFYTHTRGYLRDPTYGIDSPYANDHPYDGRASDWGIRNTLKWDPDSNIDGKLKLSYGHTLTDGPAALSNTICGNGTTRATGSNLPCGVGGYAVSPSSGPLVGTIPGSQNFFGDGQAFVRQDQFLAGLELNFRPSDALKLTSVTGEYWVSLASCQNYENDTSIILPSCSVLKVNQVSEELRASSDFRGPLNFAAGIYVSDSKAASGSHTYLFGGDFDLLAPGLGGPSTPVLLNNYYLTQAARAYSGYLQGIFKPIEVLEIDAGGRYSYERKSITVLDGGGLQDGFAYLPGTSELTAANAIAVPDPHRSWSNFSPEVTVAYRPSHEWTLFASYKSGFLSGGFNSSSNSYQLAPNIGYDPETVRGVEIGSKQLLLNDTLAVNVAAYHYKGIGLQVTNFQNSTSTIRNAADAKIQGFEVDFSYNTPIHGLGLHGAADYNNAEYTSFPNAPCYSGQSPALGCNLNGNSVQSLAGKPLPRAPRWNLAGGISYDTSLPNSMKLGVSTDLNYSSSYLTDATDNPQGLQGAYTMIDAQASLSNETDVWSVAVVGKNLTDKNIYVATFNTPFTGTTGGVVPAVKGDLIATVSRGREAWLMVSYRLKSH